MPTSQKPERDPKKVTSKDIPGSGMARKAGEAIEARRAQQQELMHSLFGSKKKEK